MASSSSTRSQPPPSQRAASLPLLNAQPASPSLTCSQPPRPSSTRNESPPPQHAASLPLLNAQPTSLSSTHRASLPLLNAQPTSPSSTRHILLSSPCKKMHENASTTVQRTRTVDRPIHETRSHSHGACLFACTHLGRRVIRGRQCRALQNCDGALT